MPRFVASSAADSVGRGGAIASQPTRSFFANSSVCVPFGRKAHNFTLLFPLYSGTDNRIRIHAFFRRDLMQNSPDITISVRHGGQKAEDNAKKKRLDLAKANDA